MAYAVPYGGTPAGRAPNKGQGPNVVRQYADSQKGGSKKPNDKPGEQLVKRRHKLWTEHHVRWQQLMDAFDGGQQYRSANYGPDRRGLPVRNLLRHRREYPDPQMFPNLHQGYADWMGSVNTTSMIGLGQYPGMLGAADLATYWDDDYEARRARTPVPEWLSGAVAIHLGKIYDQMVSREGPPELKAWWGDVDNTGTPIDDWMRESLAPLLMQLGMIDVCWDRPQIPQGTQIISEADEKEYGLDRVCASIILPENMVWWRNDNAGNYLECLVREFMDLNANDVTEGNPSDVSTPAFAGSEQWINDQEVFRHWTERGWTLYKQDGEVIAGGSHQYGFVPIRRFIDVKRHRIPMIGKSRYEAIMELSREYYNRNSELIVSDTIQAHALLSGPEDFCKADNTISVGPGYVLPKKHNPENGTYEGWEYVSPPKDPAQSIRENMRVLRDESDRHASLTKPAGTPGTTGGTVAQSGISKELDAHSGNKVLTDIAKSLARVERQAAEFAIACQRKARMIKPAERAAIKVTYPERFNLKTTNELLNELLMLLQANALANGAPMPQANVNANPDGESQGINPEDVQTMKGLMKMPQISPTLVGELVTLIAQSVLTGRAAQLMDQIKQEVVVFFEIAKVTEVGRTDDTEALEGAGSGEQMGAFDPTGISASTSVSPGVPITE